MNSHYFYHKPFIKIKLGLILNTQLNTHRFVKGIRTISYGIYIK